MPGGCTGIELVRLWRSGLHGSTWKISALRELSVSGLGTVLEPPLMGFQSASTRFDLTTICPPYVLGPIIHEVPSPDSLNTCRANLMKLSLISSRRELVCLPPRRENNRRRHSASGDFV